MLYVLVSLCSTRDKLIAALATVTCMIPTLSCAYFSKNLFLGVAVGTAAYIVLGSVM